MTGSVVPPGGEELREALLSTLVRKGVWPLAVAEVAADALLPLIEEQGRRRAAEELRAAAAEINEQRWRNRNGIGEARDAEQVVRARAAALAPEEARPE